MYELCPKLHTTIPCHYYIGILLSVHGTVFVIDLTLALIEIRLIKINVSYDTKKGSAVIYIYTEKKTFRSIYHSL